MYSVLLIDDEAWVLEDLKTLIDWQAHGFEIVATACSAEEAEHLLHQVKPAVVISDIRMPGLSGIRLLEKYADSDLKFETVFVTAYGKFDYAKKALDLGAFGYLLKPVEVNELTAVLRKLKEKLDAAAGVDERLRFFEKTKILYALMDGYGDGQDRQSLMAQIGIQNFESKFVLALAAAPAEVMQSLVSELNAEVAVLYFTQNQTLLYMQCKTGTFNLVSYKNLVKDLRTLAERENIFIGISRVMPGNHRFRTAFMQAENALDSCFVNQNKFNAYWNGEKRIATVLAFLDKAKEEGKTVEILEQLPAVINKNKLNIENVLPVLEQLSAQLGIGIDSENVDAKELVNAFDNLEAYMAYLRQCACDNAKPKAEKPSSRHVIKEITDYIQNNYYEKIMVNDLAQKFFLNPSYLSNLFKIETGKSFTAYLVECRLKNAAHLLESTDLSLYEIGTKVGYEDYFHFSKLFKKHMNISPANYRKEKAEKKSL